MATKDKLLELLESCKGEYLSGEDAAQKLSVSRASIWKAVKSLQNEGYPIDAVTNRGYSLSSDTDILSSHAIKNYLNDKLKNNKITVLQSVDSTNKYIRERAASSISDGYTVIANKQTAGRGRRGRSFFSPDCSGLYMSIFLKPQNYSAQKAVKITTMAAVAVCDAIKEVSDTKPQIKWVNDIFINGKKVCGILTEASFDLESSTIDYAVLGVGINVYAPQGGFPEEIKNIAGSVFNDKQEDIKNRLAAAFLNHFFKIYYSEDELNYFQKYREYSFVVGKDVTVISLNGKRDATVLGIDNDCHLHVRFSDGSEDFLSSGEISIKV